MNNVTSFVAITAAIFTAITVLLVLMAHLELRGAGSRDRERRSNVDRSEANRPDGRRSS